MNMLFAPTAQPGFVGAHGSSGPLPAPVSPTAIETPGAVSHAISVILRSAPLIDAPIWKVPQP